MRGKENLTPYTKYKAFLWENKITQREEAEMIGVTPPTFSKKINRKFGYDFSLKEVRTICKKHKLNANEFFLI